MCACATLPPNIITFIGGGGWRGSSAFIVWGLCLYGVEPISGLCGLLSFSGNSLGISQITYTN